MEAVIDAATLDPHQFGDLPDGTELAASEVAGIVWKIQVAVGDTVSAGQTLVIVESMKMEIAVTASCSGTVLRLHCKEGSAVAAGQPLLAVSAITSEQKV